MGEQTGDDTVAPAANGATSAPGSRDGAEALPPPPPAWTASVVPSDPLESLRLATAELAGALSLDRVAAVVAKAAERALSADSILVGIWEEVGRHTRVLHERGLSTAARQRLPAVLAAASSARQGNGYSDAPPLDSVAQALAGDGARDGGRSHDDAQGLAALMPPHERPLGIVFVGRSHGGAFSQGDRRFLDALAAVSALALERLRAATDPRRLRFALQRQTAEVRFTGSHAQVGDMQIDLGDQEVVLGDRRARLTPSELRILLFLAAEPGRARTRREILRHLWHTEHVGDERACDAHISNLRRKIERDPSHPNRVVTVRGVGYALRLPRNGS